MPAFLAVSPALLIEGLVEHGTRLGLIAALAIALYGATRRLLPRGLKLTMSRARRRGLSAEEEQRADTLARVLVHVAGIVIVAIAAFMALSELGLDITPVLAGAGIAGVALGFGAQSLVKDILGGLFILMEDQYSKGDVVCVAGVCGLVEDFNLRRTVLRDLDGTVYYVPNGEIRVAGNLSKEFARVNLDVGVSYRVDLDRAIAIIDRVGRELAADPRFADDILEAPQVLRVDRLGDSGVVIKVLGATKRLRQWDVAGELRRRLKQAFDEEGIEVSHPHMVVIRRDASTAPRLQGR